MTKVQDRMRERRLAARKGGKDPGAVPTEPASLAASVVEVVPDPAASPAVDAVIFLDVMGTLNGHAERVKGGDEAVAREKCAVVNDVVRETGARIVVSSSIRNKGGCRDLLLAGGLADAFHEDWSTGPWASETSLVDPRRRRGSEIHAWLARHPEVTRYVILDDDFGGLLRGQMRHLVECRFETGLTPMGGVIAIERLVDLEA